MPKKILKVEKVYKSFIQPDKEKLVVLEDLSLQVETGSMIALTGVSGSGKSTFLHLVGSLDSPDSGQIYYFGKNIADFSTREREEYRNQKIGFVYQFHYLMPELNVLENVAFPFLIKEFDKERAFARAEKILSDVGLSQKLLNMPYQLSGGERQRSAIARSLINSPSLLLADEPTGNLDWKTGEKVFNMLKDLIRDLGLTAMIVTHNEQLANLVDNSYHLHCGKIK